jgi:hypothetical protein
MQILLLKDYVSNSCFSESYSKTHSLIYYQISYFIFCTANKLQSNKRRIAANGWPLQGKKKNKFRRCCCLVRRNWEVHMVCVWLFFPSCKSFCGASWNNWLFFLIIIIIYLNSRNSRWNSIILFLATRNHYGGKGIGPPAEKNLLHTKKQGHRHGKLKAKTMHVPCYLAN